MQARREVHGRRSVQEEQSRSLDQSIELFARADRAVAGFLFGHLDARPGGGVVLADQQADIAPVRPALPGWPFPSALNQAAPWQPGPAPDG
jgi:hypothetical protein